MFMFDDFSKSCIVVDDEALQNDPKKLGQSLTTWRQKNQLAKLMF